MINKNEKASIYDIIAYYGIYHDADYWLDFEKAEEAMRFYSDQQNAEMLSRIAQLETENQMLVDRINEIEK